ncbi:hypothetical protein, partial [uncultured Treponema sp.]|uniref:hypothetical protein n=1 Tax=uncultured Treponema sp. TaxID=162155 RepID=UPI00262BF0AD
GGFERKVNVFLCYEIISRLAQRTFSSFENFYVLPNAFSTCAKIFTAGTDVISSHANFSCTAPYKCYGNFIANCV